MDGVVKLVPVAKTLPPEDDEYHRTVTPEFTDALNVTVPVPSLEPGVVPVIVGRTFTVAVIAIRDDETELVLELYASA